MAILKKGKVLEEKSRLTPIVKVLNRIPIGAIRSLLFSWKTQIVLHRREFGALAIFAFEFLAFGMMVMLALHLIGFPISIGALLGGGSAYYVLTQLFGEWHESKRRAL